jgi:Plant mobile domain
LDCRAHRPVIPFHESYGPALKKLGLYQLVQIQHTKTDHRLITALVERWRPETHTFHMPVGEVGLTLQDVSCLWGLPINGLPIIGPSDRDSAKLIKDSFGIEVNSDMMKIKRRAGENQEDIFQQSGFRISLKWLRTTYRELPDNATAEEVAQYTRAFLLDLFGSMVFPDSSGDSVPAMYLRFLQNLDDPSVYNWGAAVLSCLYRNMSIGCMNGKKTIGGPLLLLQHWSWTRFPIARPRSVGPVAPLGGEDLEARPPFAVRWQHNRTYEVSPAHSCLTYYRNEFESMLDEHVNWRPYDYYLDLLPARVHSDQPYWLARVPMIHFWMISWHYPERVMRQFELFQTTPPPDPHHWTELKRLNQIVHSSRQRDDWSVKHRVYVDMWQRPEFIQETRPYDPSQHRRYRQWFQTYGMYTVYIRGQIELGLDRPLPAPRDSIEELGYVPGGPRIRRMVYNFNTYLCFKVIIIYVIFMFSYFYIVLIF